MTDRASTDKKYSMIPVFLSYFTIKIAYSPISYLFRAPKSPCRAMKRGKTIAQSESESVDNLYFYLTSLKLYI